MALCASRSTMNHFSHITVSHILHIKDHSLPSISLSQTHTHAHKHTGTHTHTYALSQMYSLGAVYEWAGVCLLCLCGNEDAFTLAAE